ncbi:MAG: FAD-binding oxidoreductase [Anaerolineales bacterium]|nr:FAD-binding oxidoreductase [Anaerolineales bacterium]
MRRWNGWGDEQTDYPLPENAAAFLEALVGAGRPFPNARLEDTLHYVPASRLPAHPLVNGDPLPRLLHARGHSLPDWLALRTGRIPAFPDGVAYPETDEDVRQLIRYARDAGAHLIPYGGGTSVVGHINPQPDAPPVLTVDMQRMKLLRSLDETSQLATFGAGVQGPDLEAQLRAYGYTLGHYPQSFEYSTLGGWVATRSSGQQSLGYGRIEALFAGGRLESPAGSLEMPPHPASAAGPDLRQMVLGSEGRLGILTEATVRISPLPEREDFHAVFFADFASGQRAARQILQADLPLSLLRLSTDVETTTTLALAGHELLIGTLERLLALRGVADGKCMLLLGFTGRDTLVKAARKLALAITGEAGGVHVGRTFGSQWHHGRFRTPYLRNTLWDAGYAVDTLETATTWANVPRMLADIEAALRPALAEDDERVHVFTHLSHMYAHGASVYTTYLFRLAPDPDETLARWQRLKAAASHAIIRNQGTISHQHGVGTDHAPYLAAEKGALGIAALRDVMRRFDPDCVMNPGKLVSESV